MALANAAVTKDMLANRVYGGIPAIDLTDKLGAPYEDIADGEKLARLMRHWDGFQKKCEIAGAPFHSGAIRLTASSLHGTVTEETGCSVFDVSTRTYSKNGSECETAFMRHLLPHVKFYPRR